MSAISTGITSIKIAIDLAKELKRATTVIKDAEVKLKIAELLESIVEVKIQLVNAQSENLELKAKIKKLKSALVKEGKPEGPFCSNCFSSKKPLSLLTEVKGTYRRFGKYECPSCEQRFGK